MPPLSRKGDECKHEGYTSHVIEVGSDNVFANGIPVARLGDSVTKHCKKECHKSVFCVGSNKVYVNGKPAIRVGDSCLCNSKAIIGSHNVFSN